MTDYHEIEYILGIQIQHDCLNKTLTLSQDKYIYIISKQNCIWLTTLNCIATPLEVGIWYSRHQSNALIHAKQLLMSQIPYKQARARQLVVPSYLYSMRFGLLN